MVGEPLLRMGEDFMGVRLPVEMDPPRIGGSGLAGRGCASVGQVYNNSLGFAAYMFHICYDFTVCMKTLKITAASLILHC